MKLLESVSPKGKTALPDSPGQTPKSRCPFAIRPDGE